MLGVQFKVICLIGVMLVLFTFMGCRTVVRHAEAVGQEIEYFRTEEGFVVIVTDRNGERTTYNFNIEQVWEYQANSTQGTK